MTPAFCAAAEDCTPSATRSAGPEATARVLAALATGAAGTCASLTPSPPTLTAASPLAATSAVALPGAGQAAFRTRSRVWSEAAAALSFGALEAPALSTPTLSIFASAGSSNFLPAAGV